MNRVKPVKFFGPALSTTWLTQFDLKNFANLYVNGVAAEGLTHGFRLGGNGVPGFVENLVRLDLRGTVSYTNLPEGGGCVTVHFRTER